MTQTTSQTTSQTVTLHNNGLTRDLRRLMADAAGCGMLAAMDYHVTHGDAAPAKTGCGGGHFTRGGARISHPSAYAKVGWSNMVYHTSTRKVTVGIVWLARVLRQTPEVVAALASGQGYDLKTQAEILCAVARRQGKLTRKAAEEAVYAASCPSPTGAVRFDAEGGFRIEPSAN